MKDRIIDKSSLFCELENMLGGGLMMRIVNNSEMKALDKIAIEEYKIPGIILMENAGITVAKEVMASLKNKNNKNVAVFCGLGNNGGDGLVAARHLMNLDIRVDIYIIGNPEFYKGDAKINYDILTSIEASIFVIENQRDLNKLEDIIDKYAVLIDGIFGTGLHRCIEGIEKNVISIMNNSKKEIISIDIPSGISGDDGQVYGIAVKAHKTIVFQLPKIGNILYPGREYCGKLFIRKIGIPTKAIDEMPENIRLVTERMLQGNLPKRNPDTHKGTYGKALIIGGSIGMSGAVILASKGALKTGAGIVKAVIPEDINDIVENQFIEGITIPIKDSWYKDPSQFLSLQEEDALAIGPGGGKGQDFKNLLSYVIRNTSIPMVIDADGLNLLAEDMSILKALKAPCILTPHPGEMARMTGLSIEEINSNRIKITRDFSRRWRVITLLKGATTIISDESGRAYINNTGNPGMATAGSGDVLTGMITGLLAQGISPLTAAITGAYLHGRAGDRAAKKYGQYSLLAGDILQQIPKVFKEFVGV